jgi:uncharacterized protein (TIGR02231 family)
MKSTIVIAAAVFASFLSKAENTVKVTSELTSVTVFRSGCQMFYKTTAQVGEGRSEIRITNLPAEMTENSIQAKIEGGATLLGVTFEKDYFTPVKESKINQYQDSIVGLDWQIRLLNDQRNVLELEEQTLKNNQKLGSTQNGMSPTELRALLEVTRSKGNEIKRLMYEVDLQINKINLRKNNLQNQINEWNSVPSKVSGVVILSVLSKVANKSNITLNFRMQQASWQPVYDLRKDGRDGKIQLNFRAQVDQSTGVDWKDVQLKISTSLGETDHQLPILSPMFINFYTPPVYGTYGGKEMLENVRVKRLNAAPAVRGDMAVSMSMDDADGAKYEYKVDVSQNQLNAEYAISLPQTIRHGGKATVVPVMDYELPCTMDYVSIPKLRNQVFLMAKITDWGQYNLTPGLVNLFIDGSYIGNTFFDPTAVTDTLAISLGKDQKMSVNRIQLNDFKEKKILGLTIKETYGYEITLRNNNSESVNVQVFDQIPISRNAEIEVEQSELTGASLNKDLGEVHWSVALKANESKKVRLIYSVKYPKGKQVQFGN